VPRRPRRWVGGEPPYGYARAGRHEPLSVVEAEASVVRRIYEDYASGLGQRATVRRLNDERIPGPTGRGWQQSTISRILSQSAYMGSLKGVVAEHEPIIEPELWERVRAIRNRRTIDPEDGRRRGKTAGRTPDSPHLLTGDILRCSCGAAMLPRKVRKGVERDRYVCRARIEGGAEQCSQPSIRRELIDGPLLTTLLDGYIDIEATRERIEERAASALNDAQKALADAEAEARGVDAAGRLARIRKGWQRDVIDDAEYAEQTAEVKAEGEATAAAVEQARTHVEQVEQGIVPGDAEQALLDHLARLKRAVGEGVGAAPDVGAIRNVIRDLFAAVRLVRSDASLADFSRRVGEGFVPFEDELGAVELDDQRYWLLLEVAWSAVDADTFKPIGQAMPVPWSGQYPPGFLARYCWWYSSA